MSTAIETRSDARPRVAMTRLSISQMWEKSRKLPLGDRLFSYLVGRAARYTGTIGAVVSELETGRAVVKMRDRPLVRNHLQSVHAIALMNLGELTTGLVVMYQVDGRGRGIIKKLEMEYLKKARGSLTATSEQVVEITPGQHELIVVGHIRDQAGEEVARATATWLIQIFDA
jgi:acyl-coenzyme A thioesterase PaaI-like protein